jgi:hypothetical protein
VVPVGSRGIKGEGTYKDKADASGTMASDVEGEYEPPAAKKFHPFAGAAFDPGAGVFSLGEDIVVDRAGDGKHHPVTRVLSLIFTAPRITSNKGIPYELTIMLTW